MTENQFNELFRLVSTAVNKISVVEEKLDNLENRFDNLQKEVHEFREETNDNFKQASRDMKSLNVRDSRREKEIADMRVDTDELTERVETLEKEAA